MLVPEASIHLVEDAALEVNDEKNNVDLEQEVKNKGKDKGKEKKISTTGNHLL